ncbi:MAG: C39 family peptidase [Lachnospiraceae bacterium]
MGDNNIMGDNNLKPIVGKSPVLTERKIREEQEIRRQRRIKAQKRKKMQQIKAVATLTMFLCIIAFGIGAIVYLVTGDTEKNGDNIVNGNDTEPVISEDSYVTALDISPSDYIYDCSDTEVLGKLSGKAEKNKIIKYIYDNYKAYPDDVLKAVANNSEVADFAVKYPVEIKKEHEKVLSVEGMYKEGEMPLFIQWDDKWGYYPYGEDVMGISGCGPTCLSMVMVALTGKNQYTPTAMADFAMENGYYYNGAGTTWDLFNEGVAKLGLSCRTVGLSETSMAAALENGEYLILSMSPGIFTAVGHYIVIYGYEDGEFLVKDPNSQIRSKTTYKYEAFKDQIKNIWAIGI